MIHNFIPINFSKTRRVFAGWHVHEKYWKGRQDGTEELELMNVLVK